MRLSEEQLRRVEESQQGQLRVERMLRMSYPELETLLSADPARAAVWVRSAAQHGIPAAQLRLGRLLLEGAGVPRDPGAALGWFIRAAQGGDAEAMNMAGRCHENGWGVPVDLGQAAAWYRASAEAGHDWGEYNFGNLLFDGRGVRQDLPQAVRWYAQAALKGHARAMNLLGRCLEEGWGCPRSRPDACYWYSRSAHAGYFRAQFNHALTLAARGEVEEAAQWFWRSATGGDRAFQGVVLRALAGAKAATLQAVAQRIEGLLQQADSTVPANEDLKRD